MYKLLNYLDKIFDYMLPARAAKRKREEKERMILVYKYIVNR